MQQKKLASFSISQLQLPASLCFISCSNSRKSKKSYHMWLLSVCPTKKLLMWSCNKTHGWLHQRGFHQSTGILHGDSASHFSSSPAWLGKNEHKRLLQCNLKNVPLCRWLSKVTQGMHKSLSSSVKLLNLVKNRFFLSSLIWTIRV